MTTSKSRTKKNPAKEVAKPPPEEAKIKKQNSKEQNAAIQEDISKTKKNMKTAKKGKKAAPREKLNAAVGKANEAQTEEAALSEVDVKENGEAHMVELKQKKRNAGKANAAMNGKVEAKGKQKKGQAAAASIEEKEVIKDVIAENETTEINASEIDENDEKYISWLKDDTMTLEDKKEEEKFNDIKADSIKNDSIISLETSDNKMERTESFLCL